jgi:hypothetical protein
MRPIPKVGLLRIAPVSSGAGNSVLSLSTLSSRERERERERAADALEPERYRRASLEKETTVIAVFFLGKANRLRSYRTRNPGMYRPILILDYSHCFYKGLAYTKTKNRNSSILNFRSLLLVYC